MKRQKLIISAITLAVAAIVAAFGFRKDKLGEERLPVQMVDSNDRPVAFSDLKGKVLFVNNWASWCPPCIAEMPSIHELKEKLGSVDVEFVMVSFDEDKNKEKAFMTKRKLDFKVYFPKQEYPFVTSSIPAAFIIDKVGKTVAEHVGITDYSNDEIANQLRTLANE
jgi:thiol-disulfide isomerase/thioredoxin